MKILSQYIAVCIFILSFPSLMMSQNTNPYLIYNGHRLLHGYDMGVNTSKGRTNWLRDNGRELVMTYPAGQGWGAVFITVGKPQSDPEQRRSKNFSTLDTLVISMKGDTGNEIVDIGIKDKNNYNDGSETKKSITLSTTYKEYKFALRNFTTADLHFLYVVCEFVFDGNKSIIIFVNSVTFK